MVSSIGADPSREGDDTFSVYLRAKGQADLELEASGLDYTIVRPASLRDEPGTGRVHLAEHVGGGSISRQDVAPCWLPCSTSRRPQGTCSRPPEVVP